MTGRDGEVAQAPAAPTVEKPGLRKLKPGPGLSRQAVAKNQKLRLQAALSDLVAESGYDAVTVRALTRRANVSTSTFYKHYESVEGCLVGIIGMTIRSVATEVRQSQELDGDVIAGLRKALRSLMDRLAQEPQRAQTVFIESSAAGPRVRDETDAALGELEALLVHTFAVAPRPAAGTKHLAVGLVAGVVGIIRRTTLAGRVDELPGLAGDLTDWMLSVADEEVVTFLRQRSRSVDGNVGDRLQRLGVGSATRESVTGGVNRAIATAARLAATNGLAGLSSAKIRKDAGLSRSEFDQHFASVDDCFLAAVESVSASAATTAQLYAARGRRPGTHAPGPRRHHRAGAHRPAPSRRADRSTRGTRPRSGTAWETTLGDRRRRLGKRDLAHRRKRSRRATNRPASSDRPDLRLHHPRGPSTPGRARPLHTSELDFGTSGTSASSYVSVA
jgi:AcrR family transcriptional regulator